MYWLIFDTLKYANLDKSQIDEIIGSTSIPKIQEIIRDYFNGKVVNKKNKPSEEVYAEGAAIQAALATPLSLGIDDGDGIMKVIIPRNTTIPYDNTIELNKLKDDKSSFICKIYEGERKLVKYNKLIGECLLNNIPKEEVKITITFEIDINGLLKVIIKQDENENTTEIKVKKDKNEEEIERLVEEGLNFEESDNKEIEEIRKKKENELNKNPLLKEIEKLKKEKEMLLNNLNTKEVNIIDL